MVFFCVSMGTDVSRMARARNMKCNVKLDYTNDV
jgi:hypothetical protein